MVPAPTTGQRIVDFDMPAVLALDSGESLPELDTAYAGDEDTRIERIRRIGRRMFNVADCVISFTQPEDRRRIPQISAWASAGEAFCKSLPQPEKLEFVPDTLLDKRLRKHEMVRGAPYIRFYASYPVRSRTGATIGSVSLVDYFPHRFDGDDGDSLIDLVRLVEAEIHARSMSAAQAELRKRNRTLRRKSLIDPMLDIWNRGAIMRILKIEAARCGKAGLPLSLVAVDLDYFKKINDTYGHVAGDAALVKVVSRLRACIRSQEALGRYGGEEFLVVLPAISSENAMAVAERMRAAVEAQTERIGNALMRFTISAGVASTNIFPEASADDLIHHADLALYAAKNAGRNRVNLASSDSN